MMKLTDGTTLDGCHILVCLADEKTPSLSCFNIFFCHDNIPRRAEKHTWSLSSVSNTLSHCGIQAD